MALADYFLTPLGLLGLLALVPLLVLYFVGRKPEILDLPTIQFLWDDPERAESHPRLDALRQSLLFLLQALVVVLLALSLAGPYLTSTASVAGGDAVAVVDVSASMATQSGGSTRLARAVESARDDLPASTTIVVADADPHVAARRAQPSRAAATLQSLRVADVAGDLRSAVSLATSVAHRNDRIVVYSDFADESDWNAEVDAARARGFRVELVQVGGGGTNNVGVVDLSYGRTTVTASVKNTGTQAATRTASLGIQSERVTLQPGDVGTVTFDVPAGGGRLTLSPRDSFPVDDEAFVSAPPSARIRVLVLTNDENRFLTTALEVMDEVSVTVERLPSPVTEEYDVIVFSDVDPDRLLEGNLVAARRTLRDGGGVIVRAQRDLQRVPYGDLLLVDPTGVAQSTTAPVAVDHPLTAGIPFPPPVEFVAGDLQTGQTLLRTPGGDPLLATARSEQGQVLYYGYLDDAAGFKFDYQYPIFWKRAVYYAAGRESLEDLNRRTGDRLAFDDPTTVETPDGTVTARTVALDRAGFYTVGNRRIGVSLSSESESNVVAPRIAGGGGGRVVVSAGRRPVEQLQSLVPVVALAAVALLLLEVLILVRRGDL